MLDVFERNKVTLQALDHALAHAFRNYMTVGYGVSRRFSPPGQSIRKDEVFRSQRAQSVATMFSPDATLQSLDNWAMDIHYRRRAQAPAYRSKTRWMACSRNRFAEINREQKKVLFQTPDGIMPLEQLSDGYQNVAAWCGDLRRCRVTEMNPNFKNPLRARGLLLIDEIDLHLHPLWQRQLREYINQKFPNLQILATTHSPWTAQQSQPGELFALQRRRQGASPTLTPFEGDPQKLMVHQLMLDPLFGLSTLDSRQIQEDRVAYRALSQRRKLERPGAAAPLRPEARTAEHAGLVHAIVGRPGGDQAAAGYPERVAGPRGKGAQPKSSRMIQLTRARTAAIPAGLRGAARLKKNAELIEQHRERRPFEFQAQYWKTGKNSCVPRVPASAPIVEGPTEVVAYGDVEHFRPKSVYWWLAYCYDNHLFACQICNQGFKGDRFPVFGVRMRAPKALAAANCGPDPLDDSAGLTRAAFARAARREAPGLIDPYFEDPEPYFRWVADPVQKEVVCQAARIHRPAAACFGAARSSWASTAKS